MRYDLVGLVGCVVGYLFFCCCRGYEACGVLEEGDEG